MQDVYKAIMKGKKRPDDIDKSEQDAMMSVLKDIHKMASDDMGHDIHGLKKVSVASNTVDGVKEGLDKAKNMLQDHAGEHLAGDHEADEMSDEMHPESRRHMLDKHSEMTDEEDGMADPEGNVHGMKAMEGYAKGGKILLDDEEDVQHDREHTGHEMSPAAEGEMHKEKDMKKVSSHQHSIADAMQKGTHGMHGSPEAHDEYSDLEPEELEALINHLQRYRKSSSTF